MRLYNKKECQNFFAESEKKAYSKEIKFRPKYMRKQVYLKKMQKIDFLEDDSLKTLYTNGKDCGNNSLKEIIQTNIPRQLTYEDRRNFKVRAFAHFVSFQP